MQSTLVKKNLLFISMLIVVAMACDLSVAAAPSTSQALIPTNTVIPEGVACR